MKVVIVELNFSIPQLQFRKFHSKSFSSVLIVQNCELLTYVAECPPLSMVIFCMFLSPSLNSFLLFINNFQTINLSPINSYCRSLPFVTYLERYSTQQHITDARRLAFQHLNSNLSPISNQGNEKYGCVESLNKKIGSFIFPQKKKNHIIRNNIIVTNRLFFIQATVSLIFLRRDTFS